jgi:hypothetical protein
MVSKTRMVLILSFSLYSSRSSSPYPPIGNVAAGIAIGVAGFAAGIGMVAFAEAQVRHHGCTER